LTDFPTICFFSPNGIIETFIDLAMTEPNFMELNEGWLQVVIVEYENSLLAAAGHAMSYYVVREDGILSGACEDIPHGGHLTIDGVLWSEPNGRTGEPGIMVPSGSRVYVQPGQMQGPGIGSGAEEIAWLQIMAAGQGRLVGWVPAMWVKFD
jgi:hypothetical protein